MLTVLIDVTFSQATEQYNIVQGHACGIVYMPWHTAHLVQNMTYIYIYIYIYYVSSYSCFNEFIPMLLLCTYLAVHRVGDRIIDRVTPLPMVE